MANSQSLGLGKTHHVCFIYNHARSKLSRTDDTDKSLKFVEEMDRRLTQRGYDDNFYHDRDALPGRNKFTELFRLVKCSEWIVVVLTTAFVRDCWYQYQQMATFKELLDEPINDPQSGTRRLLPILLDMAENDAPTNLKHINSLSFGAEFMTDEREWNKLLKILSKQNAITETGTGNDQQIQTLTPPTTVHDHVSSMGQGQLSTGNEYQNTAPISHSQRKTNQGHPVLHPESSQFDDLSMNQPPSIDGTSSTDSQTNLKTLDSLSCQSPVRNVSRTGDHSDGRELNINPEESLQGDDLEEDNQPSVHSTQQSIVPVHNDSLQSSSSLSIGAYNTLNFQSLQQDNMNDKIVSTTSQENGSDDVSKKGSVGISVSHFLKWIGSSIVQEVTGYEMLNK